MSRQASIHHHLVVDAFSDANQPFDAALRELERKTTPPASLQQEGCFEQGIRLKGILDTYEEIARTKPGPAVLSVLLNCETRLWYMYAQAPIRFNPFLVHWVETVQRLEKRLEREETRGGDSDGSSSVTAKGIVMARVEWIKRLLMAEKEVEVVMNRVPLKIYQDVVEGSGKRERDERKFDVQPFVDMLMEDGIYDGSEEVDGRSKSASDTRSEHQLNFGKGSGSIKKTAAVEPASTPVTQTHSRTMSAKQWKQEIHKKLDCERDSTLQDLTRLPLELPFLDFLNEVLDKEILQSYGIDPAPIITGYIQHSLRIIEKMGAPSPVAHQNASGVDETRDGIHDGEMIWEYGKEAQSRSVVLLLLFIKNLIRKSLLSPAVLYFEIQEICVRYVWIKEVREFRAWVEDGEERG